MVQASALPSAILDPPWRPVPKGTWRAVARTRTPCGYMPRFRSTPSEALFALRGRPESPLRVELIATPVPGAHLDKLARLGDLENEVGAGTRPLAEASARVDAIDRAPQPWSSFASMMGYVLVGLGVVPILGGGWADTLCAALFSVLVYGLVAWSGRLGAVATAWVPFSTAFALGVLATVVELWVPQPDRVLVVLTAVAVLLPGYRIGLGAWELLAQHVGSGTHNLLTGLVSRGKQTAGGGLVSS